MITKLKPLLAGIAMLPFVAFAQGLKVQSGTTLICSNSVKIIIPTGNFENNGNFTHGDGEVIFSGNADQEIKGSSTSSFYDLNINKSAGDLIATTDFNVDNQLIMNVGDLDLKNATVDLGNTGSIMNETETSRIKVGDINSNTGTIQSSRDINKLSDFNPGNIGVLITTDQNLGRTTVIRGHLLQSGSGSFTGNTGIARYFEVPGIGKLDANNQVKIQYWDAELNGISEADLEIYQWVEEGGIPGWWTALSGTVLANNVSSDSDPYGDYFDAPNWYSFDFTDLFTLGSKNNPLPVELIEFDAKWKNSKKNQAIINWITASEINNDFFVVERSHDAINWKNIGTTAGAGTISFESEYEFIDKYPLDKTSYYRLKQVDYNGKTSYSDIRALSKNKIRYDISVFPNPASDRINIRFDDRNDNRSVQIIIINQLGEIVKQINNNYEKTRNTITIDVSQLNAGAYNMAVRQGSLIYNHKIVIKK